MLSLGDAGWAELTAVNAEINARPYRVDLERYGRLDHWTPIDAAGGDCEDYAIAKQLALLGRGWPLAALRLATCWVETGGFHAVLTVDTADGTYVLDNRFTEPMPWEVLRRRGYRFDRRQAAQGRGWVQVREPRLA